MSFADKLQFWKKHNDDFSSDQPDPLADTMTDKGSEHLSDPQTGLPPLDESSVPKSTYGQDSLSSSDPLSSPADPFASTEQTPDSFGSSTQSSSANPFSTPSSQQKGSVGKRLASDYMSKENESLAPSWGDSRPQTQGPSSQQKSTQEHDMEVMQLKVDAIRSELNAMSQRLIKIEHLLEEQKKKKLW